MYKKKYFILITIFLSVFICSIAFIYTLLMADSYEGSDYNGMVNGIPEIILPSLESSGEMDEYDDQKKDNQNYDILEGTRELTFLGQPSYWGVSYPYTTPTSYPLYNTGFSSAIPSIGATTGWSPYTINRPTYTYLPSPSTYSIGWPGSGYNTGYTSSYIPYNSVYSATRPITSWTSPIVPGIGYNTSSYYSQLPTSMYLTTPSYFSSSLNVPTTNSYLYSSPAYSTYNTYYPTEIPSSTTSGEHLYGKPAIYLYPEEDTYVTVTLDIDGNITKTIPDYDNGWYVLATPTGTIIDEKHDREIYDYLFWEAEANLNELRLSDQGWVVDQKNLDKWFDEYLDKLGLNKKEKNQFMEYWLDRLQGANYYEIKLLSNAFLNEHAKLSIYPSPKTLIRICFHFKPLDTYIVLDEPIIETPPKREGFTVIEWGGILKSTL